MSFSVPADVANQSLDMIGVSDTIGDLQEGSMQARAALRWYMPTLTQLLRSVHWNFARRQSPLTLLNDATGQTTLMQQNAGFPITVGTGTIGMRPWVYEYQWPVDALKARFVPASYCPTPGSQIPGNISLPSTPLTTGLGIAPLPVQTTPTRFLVAQDSVPTLVGMVTDWNQYPDYQDVQGLSPAQQTVILTNQPNATLVYTALILSPDQWDPLFRQAFVALLASFLAMPCIPDKKLAIPMQDRATAAAKNAILQARISDGNEAWGQADISVDWMRTRNSGGYGRGGWGNEAGLGVLGYGWDGCGLANGDVI